MNFFKSIFNKEDKPISNYQDFWNWFQKNEKTFHAVLKSRKDPTEKFFDYLTPKLEELREGYFYSAGMFDEEIAELILTADGNIRNIAFVEELVHHAPEISGWKFTALKPSSEIEHVNIEMAGYSFNSSNILFYSNEHEAYPDEIDISIVHSDLNDSNRETIENGIYIFIDHYLGELNSVTTIDNLQIVKLNEAQKELIPIVKLKDFLIWRQKEFLEKYEGAGYNPVEDTHSCFEAKTENGNMALAVINTQLLQWDRLASHPWMAVLNIKYDGSQTNGMPNDSDYDLLNIVEDEIMKRLTDTEGYLNVGRETANGEREIYFACKDFRKPSKIYYEIKTRYGKRFEIDYSIYKDKYWKTFNRFRGD